MRKIEVCVKAAWRTLKNNWPTLGILNQISIVLLFPVIFVFLVFIAGVMKLYAEDGTGTH